MLKLTPQEDVAAFGVVLILPLFFLPLKFPFLDSPFVSIYILEELFAGCMPVNLIVLQESYSWLGE